MRVSRHKVDEFALEQPFRGISGMSSPKAGENRSRDLDCAAQLGPLNDACRVLLNNRVTLGMSDDGSNSVLAHLGEPVINLRRNAEIAELDEQVVTVSNAV